MPAAAPVSSTPPRVRVDVVQLVWARLLGMALLSGIVLVHYGAGGERETARLYEVTAGLAAAPDIASVLDLVTAKAVELLGCARSGRWRRARCSPSRS